MFPPWRVKRNNHGMLKLLKPAIQGTASDESGSFKEKKVTRHDCGADTLGSFALLVSHDFKFQHICKVVVIKIVRMGMLQILTANRLQDVTAKVETEPFLVYSVSLLLFSWLPCQLN